MVLSHFCTLKYVYFYEFYEFQTEMTSEEKRQEHQRELASKINEDARERLKGLKGDDEEKK